MSANWTFENQPKFHLEKAIKALEKVKEQRKGKQFTLIQIDNKTWKEVEI